MNRAPDLTKGQASIAAHREHQADRRRLDSQGTDADRDKNDAQIDITPEGAQRVLNNRWQRGQIACTLSNPLDLWIIRNREQHAAQEEQTGEERETDRPEHPARGVLLRISGLLAERAGCIEAVNREERHKHRRQESAAEACAKAWRPGLGGALEVGMRASKEEADRLVIVENQEHQREAEHTNDFSGHANIVNNRNQAHAGHIDQRTYNNRDQSDKDRTGHAQNRRRNLGEDGGQRNWDSVSHSGHREHAGEEIDPAGEPAQTMPGQALAPLIDRARDGEVRRQFGKIERHQKLAKRYNWPGPEKGRTSCRQAQIKERERASRDGDVGEGHGEIGDETKRAPQLLPDRKSVV